MNKLSERRLAENEVIFRQINSEIKEFVIEDALSSTYAKQPLRFYCECSNMDCRERIEITADEYDSLHKDTKHFVLRAAHFTPEIERVVKETDKYIVVEKYNMPPVPEEIDPKRFL